MILFMGDVVNTYSHFLLTSCGIFDTLEIPFLFPHKMPLNDSCASYDTIREQPRCLSSHPETASTDS